MTTIEFQNALNSFFQVENGHVKVKDLTISDDIIQISANDNNSRLKGIQIMRGEQPPLNIVWDEETKTLNYTVGAELAKLNCYFPEPKVVNMVDETFIEKDVDVVIVDVRGKTLHLPKEYKKYLKIKVNHSPVKLVDSKGKVVKMLNELGTYTFIQHKEKWEDLS